MIVTITVRSAGDELTVREILRDLIDNLDTVQADDDDMAKVKGGVFCDEPLYTDDGVHRGALWNIEVTR